MSKIKSLADQLKSKLEEQKKPAISIESCYPKVLVNKNPEEREPALNSKQLDEFINSLREFNLKGQEKILIRIDKRTLNTLKQLKAATNIDMTRVIVFSLHRYLKAHPWLNKYISKTLNNMTHELD